MKDLIDLQQTLLSLNGEPRKKFMELQINLQKRNMTRAFLNTVLVAIKK